MRNTQIAKRIEELQKEIRTLLSQIINNSIVVTEIHNNEAMEIFIEDIEEIQEGEIGSIIILKSGVTVMVWETNIIIK